MERPHSGTGHRLLVGAAICLALALLMSTAGCEQGDGRYEVRKPVVEIEARQTAELDSILHRLRAERDQLHLAVAAMERHRQESVARLARTAGDDYQGLLQADSGELRILVADVAGGNDQLAIHLRELAQHAAHLDVVERRLILLEAAIVEAEAHQRLLANYASVNADPPMDAMLLGKLDAVARQTVELPAELSPEEVAGHVTDQLAMERESAQRRQQLQAAEREARRRVDEQAALAAAAALVQREEAARQAWLEASRRTAEADARREAEMLANQYGAMALKRYADAYHQFFQGRYRDAAVLLDEAIALDGDDPRFHYFRGLVRLRLGRSDLALADFQAGGEVERVGGHGVGQALERIQGQERTLVERYRP